MKKVMKILGCIAFVLILWSFLFMAFSFGITAEMDHQDAVTKQYQADMDPAVLEACIYNN